MKIKSEVLRPRTSDFKKSKISTKISLIFDMNSTHFAVLAAQRHQLNSMVQSTLLQDPKIISMGVGGSNKDSEPPSHKIQVFSFAKICKMTSERNLEPGDEGYS